MNNKQDFLHLKHELIKHHRKCIDNDCTADPVFVVKTKQVEWGYEEEYAEVHALYYDCETYESVEDFLYGYDPSDLVTMCKGTEKSPDDLLEMDIKDFRDFLEYEIVDEWYKENLSPEVYMIHGNYKWVTHNMFLTRESAEEYVERRCSGLDNPDVNIWVESWWRNYEMKNLLKAIMDGKLVWNEEIKSV